MEWQPIETAPKDGREIIAYGVRHGTWGYTYDEATWTGVKWFSGSRSQGGWMETKPAPQYSNGFTPTHWMPLPEPPHGND